MERRGQSMTDQASKGVRRTFESGRRGVVIVKFKIGGNMIQRRKA